MKKLLLLLLFVCVSAVLAQNAGIDGLVTDSSGARLPNAGLVITNQDTGVKRSTTSNEQGYYTVPSLQTGIYQIVVSATGFQPARRERIELAVGQQLRLDFTLLPGNTQETVEVHAEVVALNSDQVEFATTLNDTLVGELPLSLSGSYNGWSATSRRMIDDFIFLVPGASGNSFSHRFNGGISFSNEVLYNGVPYVFSDAAGWQGTSNPPYDAVDQFKVLTSVFTAQYGHGQGAVNYNFASGTNKLHGTLHEIVRNDAFDARGFFSKNVSLNRQNEYGFTVGGPVWIPKIYNGRNKTFFNFAVEWFKYRGAPLNGMITVPTLAMRDGDFSGLLDTQGNQIPIYDPTTRTPFPDNRIPASRFSSVARQLTALIPDPATSGLTNNLGYGIRSLPTNDVAWSVRIDHSFSERNQLSYSMWRESQTTTAISGSNMSGPLGSYMIQPQRHLAVVLNDTYTIRNNLVMTLGLSFAGPMNNQFPVNTMTSELGLNIPGVAIGDFLPGYHFSGPYAAPGQLNNGGTGSINRRHGLGLMNNFLWVKGRHALNIGYEWRRPYGRNTQGGKNAYTFSNVTTSLPNDPNYSSMGHPFASFLLGLADSASYTSRYPTNVHSSYTAAYLQDDFKATSKLTLNLGARWDVFVPFVEVNNNIAFLNTSLANPAAGGIAGAMQQPGSCSGCAGSDRVADIHWRYVAPRLGIAYAPNQKTVLRAGVSVTFLNAGASEFGVTGVRYQMSNGLVPQATYTSLDSGFTPGYGSIDRPFPVPAKAPFDASVANGQNVSYMGRESGRVPYTTAWMFGIQRELPGQIMLSASYVGNRTVRAPSTLENINQVPPQYLALGSLLQKDIYSPEAVAAGLTAPYAGYTGTVRQALRPYPQYRYITSLFDLSGSGEYNALQMTLQKRLSAGLDFMASYTASRFYSNTSSSPLDTYNRSREWGLDSSDQPHSLVVSGIYELPFGPGKKLLNVKGIAGHILGGWQAGYVLRYASGAPIGFGASNLLPISGNGNRPNAVAGVNPCRDRSNFDPATDSMFNSAAFSQPADYTFGNAPAVYGNCRGFPLFNEDVNVAKSVKFSESVNLEFRAEFFNVFNRVQFSTGDTGYSPSNSNFGFVGSQANSPRSGQFALRLHF